jgi:hypothetical protein
MEIECFFFEVGRCEGMEMGREAGNDRRLGGAEAVGVKTER